jgi:hypothetical protein
MTVSTGPPATKTITGRTTMKKKTQGITQNKVDKSV